MSDAVKYSRAVSDNDVISLATRVSSAYSKYEAARMKDSSKPELSQLGKKKLDKQFGSLWSMEEGKHRDMLYGQIENQFNDNRRNISDFNTKMERADSWKGMGLGDLKFQEGRKGESLNVSGGHFNPDSYKSHEQESQSSPLARRKIDQARNFAEQEPSAPKGQRRTAFRGLDDARQFSQSSNMQDLDTGQANRSNPSSPSGTGTQDFETGQSSRSNPSSPSGSGMQDFETGQSSRSNPSSPSGSGMQDLETGQSSRSNPSSPSGSGMQDLETGQSSRSNPSSPSGSGMQDFETGLSSRSNPNSPSGSGMQDFETGQSSRSNPSSPSGSGMQDVQTGRATRSSTSSPSSSFDSAKSFSELDAVLPNSPSIFDQDKFKNIGEKLEKANTTNPSKSAEGQENQNSTKLPPIGRKPK